MSSAMNANLFDPLPAHSQEFDSYNVSTTLPSGISEKQPNGFYKLVGDTKQRDFYKVQNRSAPILAQVSPDVPGMVAVSDSTVFVPEASLTEKNEAIFNNRAIYLDRYRLGNTGMTTSLDEVLAQQNNATEGGCVRMDPCPDPPFKTLSCCSSSGVESEWNADQVPLATKDGPKYPPMPIRNYGHRDTTWSFMSGHPWDRYAIIIMSVAVAIAIAAVLIMLIWSMMVSKTTD